MSCLLALTLGGERMPSTRLAPSLRDDLSLPNLSASSAPVTAISPMNAPQPTPSTASVPPTGVVYRERYTPTVNKPPAAGTLRKSYRRVLALSSGLRVRMRSLFLPQILAPRSAEQVEEDDEGEGRVALCVELENPTEKEAATFEVTDITVDVGGKGGKAIAEMIGHPGSASSTFPIRVDPAEQINVLYAVSIASSHDQLDPFRPTGAGDLQRPVAITVIGRPVDGHSYPTDTFSSRWNCTLDLASLQPNDPCTSLPKRPVSSSKPLPPPQNAIVGDKRYSLASLHSSLGSRPPSQRIVSGSSQRPLALPSQNNGGRVLSMRSQTREGYGLLLSVKILETERGRTLRVFEPFSLEVFVHNRTDDPKRFRLSMPFREGTEKIREAWANRRPRAEDEPEHGVDQPGEFLLLKMGNKLTVVLRQLLLSHLKSAPAIVPLEDDVRCGPLLPGESMAARIRFLALRDGVHSVDKMRITGANDEFDFIMK